MKPLDALTLQLRLEGREVLPGNLLRQVEIVPGEEMPWMILAQLAGDQVVLFFDESLPAQLRKELAGQTQHISFPGIDPLLDILKTHNIPFEIGHYKTYLFPAAKESMIQSEVRCCSREDPQVQAFGFGDFAQSVYVVERDTRVVTACVSARENEQCGEAWVYTDPQYRNQGLARQVVSAWAQGLLAAGKVPFYSHKITNLASANLAHRLGLTPVYEEIVIER